MWHTNPQQVHSSPKASHAVNQPKYSLKKEQQKSLWKSHERKHVNTILPAFSTATFPSKSRIVLQGTDSVWLFLICCILRKRHIWASFFNITLRLDLRFFGSFASFGLGRICGLFKAPQSSTKLHKLPSGLGNSSGVGTSPGSTQQRNCDDSMYGWLYKHFIFTMRDNSHHVGNAQTKLYSVNLGSCWVARLVHLFLASYVFLLRCIVCPSQLDVSPPWQDKPHTTHRNCKFHTSSELYKTLVGVRRTTLASGWLTSKEDLEDLEDLKQVSSALATCLLHSLLLRQPRKKVPHSCSVATTIALIKRLQRSMNSLQETESTNATRTKLKGKQQDQSAKLDNAKLTGEVQRCVEAPALHLGVSACLL